MWRADCKLGEFCPLGRRGWVSHYYWPSGHRVRASEIMVHRGDGRRIYMYHAHCPMGKTLQVGSVFALSEAKALIRKTCKEALRDGDSPTAEP